MRKSIRWFISVAGLGALLAILPSQVAAQSIWTSQDESSSFSVEWLKPEFSDAEDMSFFSSALFLSGRVWVHDDVRIVGDLPLANVDYKEGKAGLAVGNPYLGVEVGAPESPLWGEAGGRLPLASTNNSALGVGFWSDYDRCEAFMPHVLSVFALGNYQYQHRSGFSARFRAGPLLWVNTDKGVSGDRTEAYAVYSAQGWYDVDRARFGAGLTGRMIVTEADLKLDERTVHQLGVALIGKFGDVQPGLHLRMPLDKDLNDVLDFVFGMNVTVSLRGR